MQPGDAAVLIGAQGDERILAEELARRLGTINYEITCGISARVPRVQGGRVEGGSAAQRIAAAGARCSSRGRRSADGADAWVVGGAVRDAALEREVEDLDLALAADEGDAARARWRERPAGTPFQLSEEFGTWRVVDRERRWLADVTRLRGGSIEADLGRPRLHRQCGRGAARRRGAAARSPRRARRPRARSAAGGLGPRSSPTTRCASCAPPGSAPSSACELDAETIELARAEAGRAGEPAGRAPVRRAAAAAHRARPAARARAAGRARGHRRGAARARGAARRRAEPQPPPRRPRPHARGA